MAWSYTASGSRQVAAWRYSCDVSLTARVRLELDKESEAELHTAPPPATGATCGRFSEWS